MCAYSLKQSWNCEAQVRAALDAREKRWFSLLKKGHATLSETLYTDFGTNNPVGLEIDHWAGDPEIEFQDARLVSDYTQNRVHYWKFFGSIDLAEPNKVNLHPVFNILKKLPAFPKRKHAIDMFAHETIHCRQGFEWVLGFYSTSGYEFLRDIEPQDEQNAAKIKRIESRVSLRSFGKYSVKGYLSQDIEVQARMHEIMSQAYAEWGRMPVTQNEFFAAMYHTGLKLPSSIIKELERNEDGQKALDDFKLGSLVRDRVKRPVKLLNYVYDCAEACGAEQYLWRQKYIYWYGSLLELYGDKIGRARMDCGSNPRDVLIVLKCIQTSDEEIDVDTAAGYADRIPPEHAVHFIDALEELGRPAKEIAMFRQALDGLGKIPKWYAERASAESPKSSLA